MLSLIVVVEIFIYIWVVLWAGLLLGSIKFYLLCCAKEVTCIIKIALFCSLIKG